MQINILNHHRWVRMKILRYLDDESFLRLREVSGYTKFVVDRSVLSARPTRFSLNIEDVEYPGKLKLLFGVRSKEEMEMWKITIRLLARTHKISKVNLQFERNFITIMLMNENVPKFFKSLKSLLGSAVLQSLNLNCMEEVFDTLLDFLNGRRVGHISLKTMESTESFSNALKLVDKLKPVRFTYDADILTIDNSRFFIRVANFADIMQINIEGLSNRQILAQMACEIFKQKCAVLTVESNDKNLDVSSEDIEKIVKFVNSSSKKIRFKTLTDEEPYTKTIGVCNVTIRRTGRKKTIIIKHIELK